MKHVVLYVGHLYKLFWTKKIWPGWQGGSKKVKIWPRMGLAFIYFWPRSLLEAPKWVKDPGNTPKMIPPTAPHWFESIFFSWCMFWSHVGEGGEAVITECLTCSLIQMGRWYVSLSLKYVCLCPCLCQCLCHCRHRMSQLQHHTDAKMPGRSWEVNWNIFRPQLNLLQWQLLPPVRREHHQNIPWMKVRETKRMCWILKIKCQNQKRVWRLKLHFYDC